MHKGILFIGALTLTLSLGLVACGGGSESKPAPTATKAAPTATKAAPTATTAPSTGGAVLNVSVRENPYVFDPTTLNLTNGKTYSLEIPAPKEFHTFTIDELGINIYITPGTAVKQDITPNKVGTFTLKCMPHESLGMKATVTVS